MTSPVCRALGISYGVFAGYFGYNDVSQGLAELPENLSNEIWKSATVIEQELFDHPGTLVVRHARDGVNYTIFSAEDVPHGVKEQVDARPDTHAARRHGLRQWGVGTAAELDEIEHLDEDTLGTASRRELEVHMIAPFPVLVQQLQSASRETGVISATYAVAP